MLFWGNIRLNRVVHHSIIIRINGHSYRTNPTNGSDFVRKTKKERIVIIEKWPFYLWKKVWLSLWNFT
ncbi:MAG: hypothetical protein B6D56_01635 [Candidatus Omnitrophica bacterium 4484_70.1]|nr:MAG: hypothetical protein B6D56_01635 [Candidatus Omnitrophica bacterium 4484_70.1]